MAEYIVSPDRMFNRRREKVPMLIIKQIMRGIGVAAQRAPNNIWSIYINER